MMYRALVEVFPFLYHAPPEAWRGAAWRGEVSPGHLTARQEAPRQRRLLSLGQGRGEGGGSPAPKQLEPD